jgi:hypothetical protein
MSTNRFLVVLLGALAGCLPAWAQGDTSAPLERTFSYSIAVVKKGLEQIGAFAGGKLPIVDGFVSPTIPQLDQYQRPYYQYRIQLNPVDGNQTSVRVEARISAWYVDSDPAGSQYRALASNGRLEADVLDRLQEALGPRGARPEAGLPTTKAPQSSSVLGTGSPGTASPPPAQPIVPAARPSPAPKTGQEQLDALLAERQAVREKAAATHAQIEELKAADRNSAETARLAAIKHSGVGVMSRKNFGGPVLFRAQAEDEFEVLSLEPGWAVVRLAEGSTGYIQADELRLPAGIVEQPALAAAQSAPQPPKALEPDLGFWVSREDVNQFAGDWARLKGKKVLFVYAQPRGLLSDIAGDDAKLKYAKRIFVSRFHSAAQSSQAVEGVVVVFLGTKGGVAAATLTDIRQWVEGGLGDEAFVDRCSLDPPAEFRRIHLN